MKECETNKEKQELKEEARRVYGKREMLWNIQSQICAAKIKGKSINEALIMQILDGVENMQSIEEQNWEVEKYIESEIEKSVWIDSIILNYKIKRMQIKQS